MPDMDYSKLLGKIKERGYTQKDVAKRIGVSESHLCQKFAGRYLFKQSEIQAICELLEIAPVKIGEYFFTPIVEKTQHLP